MKHIALTAAFLAGMFTGMSVFSRAADALYLDVNGFSRHGQKYYTYQGQRQTFNEDNAGLGVSKQWHNNANLTSGFYRNSYNKTSVYGGADFHLHLSSGSFALRPGVAVGLVTGYDNTIDDAGVIRLYAMPSLAAIVHGVGVKVGYVPVTNAAREKGGVSVVTVQFQYQIN